MKIKAIQCNDCKDTIYSRTRSDEMVCSCKRCMVRNGYLDPIVKGLDYKWIELNYPNITMQDLYQDWSLFKDSYGIVKEKDLSRYVEVVNNITYNVPLENPTTPSIKTEPKVSPEEEKPIKKGMPANVK